MSIQKAPQPVHRHELHARGGRLERSSVLLIGCESRHDHHMMDAGGSQMNAQVIDHTVRAERRQ